MNHYIKSIPLAAVLAFSIGSVSAQTPAPMGAASAPTTIGVSPQEAAKATQKAVPRSDTATLVNTSPTAADKARSVMNDTTVAPVRSTAANTAKTPMRRARADRN